MVQQPRHLSLPAMCAPLHLPVYIVAHTAEKECKTPGTTPAKQMGTITQGTPGEPSAGPVPRQVQYFWAATHSGLSGLPKDEPWT
jgi:hypothetical protein